MNPVGSPAVESSASMTLAVSAEDALRILSGTRNTNVGSSGSSSSISAPPSSLTLDRRLAASCIIERSSAVFSLDEWSASLLVICSRLQWKQTQQNFLHPHPSESVSYPHPSLPQGLPRPQYHPQVPHPVPSPFQA